LGLYPVKREKGRCWLDYFSVSEVSVTRRRLKRTELETRMKPERGNQAATSGRPCERVLVYALASFGFVADDGMDNVDKCNIPGHIHPHLAPETK